MAKLGNYYGLCPLIDHKSLLGVTEDAESGHVIVTLGRNICIKYRISDQKQIHSWRTKDKFSSAVVYDVVSSKYAAVFNSSYIRVWNEEENIEKLKKYKFSKQIFSLVQCGGKVFVIFKDLSVSELNQALKTRKDTSVNEETTADILDVLCCAKNNEVYIGIISDKENPIFEWNVYVEDDFLYKERQVLSKRKNVDLVGYVMCHLAVEANVQLLTLWSDGLMFAYPLENSKNTVPNTSLVQNLGKRFAIFQSLSLKRPVSMAPLNQHYIALYGANCSEEGAVLLLYNTQFKVTQSKVSFKLFTSGSKLWQVWNNLLLGMGQNLAVIPYHLHEERLAMLIGSHQKILTSQNSDDSDVSIVEKVQLVEWGENEELGENPDVFPEIKDFLEQGKPESTICQEFLTVLLERKNAGKILDALDYFDDVPEQIIVKLLEFGLNSSTKCFKSVKNIEDTSDCEQEFLQPLGRKSFVNKILTLRFSDVLLLPYLRNNIDLDAVVTILFYVQYLFGKDNFSLPKLDCTETLKRLVEWSNVLLDSKYQGLILSKDERILNLLKSFGDNVNEQLKFLRQLDRLLPKLENIKCNKGQENQSTTGLLYCVEKLNLY